MEGDDSDEGVTTYQIPGPCMRPSSWQRVGSYRTALVIDLPGGIYSRGVLRSKFRSGLRNLIGFFFKTS